MSTATERLFEAAICDWLVAHGGYVAVKGGGGGGGGEFDPALGLDGSELFPFIGATQQEAWDDLVVRHGGGQDLAQRRFKERLAAELDRRGVVDVLRRGVVDQGVAIALACFRPAHGLTPELVARYEANRLTVTRQLRYEPGSTRAIDLCLLVNGIPVATAELKNPLTGQGVEQAVAQYRTDRDPRNRTLRRALVHFAVDPTLVAMTTRLAGRDTRFLPFNRGHDHGPGNPPSADGHATAYLWEEVWRRDAWLDLLGRFVHVERPAKGARRPGAVIFPRFHQWDCTRRLEAAARAEGPGHGYLVQHSAGSGKSNTIAWLAHRLSTLHAGDRKVFDKVVIVTDRLVLDRQLQETVYQLEHVHGVVQRIDAHSGQLADALAGEQARIIVTTLQKFPFVLDRVAELPRHSYAVIVDEAHSSQTGEAAKELRRVLGAGAGEGGELAPESVEEALAASVAARGRQPNLSFFAFTATPKGKTLELFGRPDPDTGRHEPFHLYSMRQAIEEGFIHDVLASYTTYETFYRLEKAIAEDPAYATEAARRAIARYVTLHEGTLAQKAAIVVEHFLAHVAHRIAGGAKAMVVCGSRPHAVRFWQALRRHVAEHGHDLGVLVAFSDRVEVDGEEWTEARCNGFPESQTARRFDGEEFRIMVVAEKFQTGFDQPRLYAMYVDKTLTGLAAVQTLSRLNRTHPAKDGTFVLDFVNDAQDIRDAFADYHVRTVAPPSDPNLLYDTRHALDEYGVLDPGEAAALAGLLLAPEVDHPRVHAALTPALERFAALADEERERFRDALARFVRAYAFLSQIVSFADTALERDYLFARALQPFIRADAGAAVDLGDAIALTHLRHERRFEGSVALEGADGEVRTVYSGAGPQADPAQEPLSRIIARLNARHGTELTEADRLVFDATADDLVADPSVQERAANNSAARFAELLPELFQKGLLARLERNEQVVYRYLDDDALAGEVLRAYGAEIRARAHVAYQEHRPIAELLGPDRESQFLELKSTLRTRSDTGEVLKPLETATLRTIAAFANSREGGTLVIGAADDGGVVGLDADYASLHKEGSGDRDRFLLHLTNIMVAALGEAATALTSVQLHSLGGRDVCRVHVRPSEAPVEATVTVERQGRLERVTAFFVRLGNATRAVEDPEERRRYVAGRWPG